MSSDSFKDINHIFDIYVLKGYYIKSHTMVDMP